MLVKIKQKSQVTIPKALTEKLKLKAGDDLKIEEKDGKLILTPVVIVPKDQAWFYSPGWQAMEKEVDVQIREGKVMEAENEEDLYNDLGL